MTELYITIGILILIILVLFVMLIAVMKTSERTLGLHVKRYLLMDTHHRSEKRYLTALLLETNGIKTGVNNMASLHSNYIDEINNMLKQDESDKKLVKTGKMNVE